MRGIILEFLEQSPFYEKIIYIHCTSQEGFENKLFNQFNSPCDYVKVGWDKESTREYDAHFIIGTTYYKCKQTVVETAL